MVYSARIPRIYDMPVLHFMPSTFSLYERFRRITISFQKYRVESAAQIGWPTLLEKVLKNLGNVKGIFRLHSHTESYVTWTGLYSLQVHVRNTACPFLTITPMPSSFCQNGPIPYAEAIFCASIIWRFLGLSNSPSTTTFVASLFHNDHFDHSSIPSGIHTTFLSMGTWIRTMFWGTTLHASV